MQKGKSRVRDAVQNALPANVTELRPREMRDLDGTNAGDWTPDEFGLPPDCPVRPLGVSVGSGGSAIGWFVDPIGQVQSLSPPYGKGHILGLFLGHADYLAWAWPRWGKKGVDGYAAEQVAASLLAACRLKGPWSQVEMIRGRGCWPDGLGGIIVHTGTELHMRGHTLPPREIDGYVYTTRRQIPGPYSLIEAKAIGDLDPAEELGKLFTKWNWARRDVDPHLLLGWIGAAFLGGALPWRPTVFITGDKATGKSTLQAIVKGVLGGWLVQAADTSAAGVYQRIGQDCVPVAVDELEGESDIRKQKAVLKLARLAASGALMLRGGDRHEGVEFQARSAFLFSSINTPPLEPQDLSRMALLRLYRVEKGAPTPQFSTQRLALLGRAILSRLLQEWHRFELTWQEYKAELAAGGMDGRGQDTFGTLLACADLISYRGWDEERLRHATEAMELVPWRELMAAKNMAEFEDAEENWRLCLSHMLSVSVDAWRGNARRTVGRVVYDYFKTTVENLDDARRLLEQCGLTLVKRNSESRAMWLAIPNQNVLTRTLFEGSKWGGEPGASVWAGALRQAPASLIHVQTAKIGGVASRCTLISLEGLYGPDGVMHGDD